MMQNQGQAARSQMGEKRDGEIAERVRRIQTSLESLSSMTDVLMERIAPVMASAPPAGTSAGSAISKATVTPLGHNLDACIELVDSMGRRLDEMLHRLEL